MSESEAILTVQQEAPQEPDVVKKERKAKKQPTEEKKSVPKTKPTEEKKPVSKNKSSEETKEPKKGRKKKSDLRNIPRFTFKGKEVNSSPDSFEIIDADTILIAFPVEGVNFLHSIRLEGFDAIESKFKTKDKETLTGEELNFLIDKREESKELLSTMITGEQIKVVLGDFDKYGRILGRIIVDSVDVNTTMLQSNLVFPYGGGTKFTLQEQVEFLKEGVIEQTEQPLTEQLEMTKSSE